MIAPEARTEEFSVRHPFGGSIVSAAGKYLKGALAKRRCSECAGSGGRKCSKCDGKGIVLGGGPTSYREPCRRCIGTGKEECPTCEGAGVISTVPAFDH